ncbi:unnamed protein product [Ambrosiozyma monospora]|uniref:Unnamed protein product n=1 Tax=Ambrosiozyma monospora TaxID=43982 RepID=A0A9W7DF91_AMBMO|nr:unnamed protein product [Ambrosiozyma monospora]
MTQSEKITSIIFADDDSVMPKPPPKSEFLQRSIMDLFSMRGKICVVTGAAREKGIGYAVAEAYCQAGCEGLALWDYNSCEPAAEKLRKLYGTNIKSYKVDVTNSHNVYETVDQVVDDFGAIDVFVANAGIAWTTGTILDEINDDDKQWHKLVDVDMNGCYYCAKSVGKVFKKQGRGSLVITASMSALIVNVPNFQMPYNVTKAACMHMAKSLGVEYSNFGARVNCVCPGYMDTGLSDFLDKKVLDTWCSLIPMGRQGIAKELAGAYLYLGSDASSYTTGSALVVDGGFTSA